MPLLWVQRSEVSMPKRRSAGWMGTSDRAAMLPVSDQPFGLYPDISPT